MRFAIVSTSFPEDPRTDVYGIHQRFGQFVEAMKQDGALDVLFFVHPHIARDPDSVRAAQARLEQQWGARVALRLCPFAPAPDVGNRVDEYVRPALAIRYLPPYLMTAGAEQVAAVGALLGTRPDVVFVQHLQCMTPLLLGARNNARVVLDVNDIDHVTFARELGQPPHWTGKPLLRLRLPLIRRWERRALGRAACAIVCSEADRRYLARTYRTGNIAVAPNAVPLPPSAPPCRAPTLLFIGRYTYQPNAVAAAHLIRDIWPRIYAARPDVRLLIAGQDPERIPGHGESALGVEYLGFVEDLAALYAKAAVVCAPILSGGGTRIKIVEAAAYGKPVVSTTIGAEGLEMQDGKHLLLRDDPVEFARACVDLLDDQANARRIGSAARSFVAERYARPAVVENIRHILREVLDAPLDQPLRAVE
jgi:glycosyltransferase involved in cell wall biosynthesis